MLSVYSSDFLVGRKNLARMIQNEAEMVTAVSRAMYPTPSCKR